jgi:ABC-2 type transport system permease protein
MAGFDRPERIGWMSTWLQSLVPYAEFSRVGFVNILAFRLRYFTGIITYFLNVTVYYFIWSAVYSGGHAIAGYNLGQMITYVSVGWMIRSFYWNTIDQEMAYEVIEGKIAMDLIKPVSVQWMWISRAIGESAFRLGLLTLPTAVVVALVFPVQRPSSRENFALFLVAILGSFFLMAAINFMIGTCAIPLKSILALIRAKYWLIELLSGLLIPMTFFPDKVQKFLAWLPFEHIAYTPLQIYLGKLDRHAALRALGVQWLWVIVLLFLAHLWWERAAKKITIHGG